MEYEKTYLLNSLPKEMTEAKSEEMVDIYVPNETGHAEIRIRKRGGQYFLTKKTSVNGDAAIHREETIRLSKMEFECLAKCSNLIIRKKRYSKEFSKYLLEVDVFSGTHEGLVLADFEFKNPEEMRSFQPPEFVGLDVTEEEFIAGGKLCAVSREELLAWLRESEQK